MSWDIWMEEPDTGENVYFTEPHHMRGGTYAVGGTTEA